MSEKGKKDKKGKVSFIKKYGLEGEAMSVQISEETKIVARALAARSKAAIEAGKAAAVLDNTKYR